MPPQIIPEPPQTAERKATCSIPARRLPILQISYKGDAFDPDNADYVAALLLADLAFGETSEIYKKLVLDEQKVQALEACVPMNRDQPLFDVIAMVKQASDLDEVRDEIYRTLERFQTSPADAEKLGPAQTPPQVRRS